MKNIFKFHKKKCNADIDKYLEVLGTTLVHELRTPFVTIKSGISIVKDSVGKLIKSYYLAKEKDIDASIPEISTKHLDKLSDFLDSIEDSVLTANFFVSLVGFILRSESRQQNMESLDVKSILEMAIEQLPKSLQEKTNLKVIDQSQNMQITADRESLKMVFCALIYEAMQRSLPNKPLVITIIATKHLTNYLLEFQDNAQRINSVELFDRYYAANGELQLGLYYCKSIMHKMGADIACGTTEDQKNVHFLRFPIT